MRSLYLFVYSIWGERTALSTAASHAIETQQFDVLYILPEIRGDIYKFESLIKNIDSRLEAISKTIPKPRVAIVQLGNLGKGSDSDSVLCINRFRSLNSKYTLFGVYGDYERGLLHGNLRIDSLDSQGRNFMKTAYVAYLTVESSWPRSSVIGPEVGNMLIVNPVLGPESSLSPRRHSFDALSAGEIKSILSRSQSESCQFGLVKVLQRFNSGRLITSGNDFSERCGSRLLTLGSSSAALMEISFEPLKISLLGHGSRPLWPKTFEKEATKAESKWNDYEAVVVIPDIHGDFDAFVDSVWLAYQSTVAAPPGIDRKSFHAQVMRNETFPGNGKRVLLVQLGDLVDRGPFTNRCLAFAGNIEYLLGWRVIRHYGNHEMMNFHRSAADYVHKEDDIPREFRSSEFSMDGRIWKQITDSFVMASAIRGDQPQSSWLFVHAGINPEWFLKYASMIQAVRARDSSRIESLNEFSTFSLKNASGLSFALEDDASPLWSRKYEDLPDKILCNEYLSRILAAFKVDRIMVGHSPQSSGKPRFRCGGRLVLADTRISRWMNFDTNNRMSNPTAYLLSSDGTVKLLQTDGSGSVITSKM